MSQNYKNIYFSDFPAENAKRKNFTLAFGEKDQNLYEAVRHLSSQELRELLGYASFAALKKDAELDGLLTNTFCLRLLKKRSLKVSEPIVQYTIPNFLPSIVTFLGTKDFTFKGGQHASMHNWFPFLEGYSPKFVETILKEFSPNSKIVYDPFAGSGTTPLTVTSLGKQAYFSEINPVLQNIVEIKSFTISLSNVERKKISYRIREEIKLFENRITQAHPDTTLADTYQQTFEDSIFFDKTTFTQILKARTAIDSLGCTEPIIAKYLLIAVLASLLISSKLIRRGDIRYKNELELAKSKTDLFTVIRDNLTLIANDLEKLTTTFDPPLLICENALELGKIPYLGIDTIITSPPYLNGTNYFRNTKIENWFLKVLNTRNDLSSFRYKSMTAGINDVTVRDIKFEVDPEINKLVDLLTEKAYDRRIPQMVAYYFEDMYAVFKSISKHLQNDAVIVVDIGDSIYSNVHVKTERLLVNVLAKLDYKLEQEIILRKRISRNGSTLKQTLLIFRYRSSSESKVNYSKQNKVNYWELSWEKFKNSLPHQKGEFSKRNWGSPLHSLCSYQGKMKPSLAAHLVKTFVPEGGIMLDPFAGVGTLPFEAALRGIKSWAFEISPLAWIISTAKLGKPNQTECLELINTLDIFIRSQKATTVEFKNAEDIKFNGTLSEYFEIKTLEEILLARRYFLINKPRNASEALVVSSLLHILHGNRPYALSRRSHPITPFSPTGPKKYHSLIQHLRDKVLRSLAIEYPEKFVAGTALFQDATSWWNQKVDQLDAIITSPPFFDSTRFYLSNWMRLWFTGWEAEDFRTKPLSFVDEKQKSGFEIYYPIFRQARERLKQGGVMVLHLGKSKKCNMALELTRISKHWFKTVDIFDEKVTHCESHGIRDKGTVTSHQYLVLY